jgi:hypothetical protein
MVMVRAQATPTIRRNFAATHLKSGAGAARAAYKIEQENDVLVFGDWYSGMMEYVPVAMIMSGASLEAFANELIEDILTGHTALFVSTEYKSELEKLKADRSRNALVRFKKIGELFGKSVDEGSTTWKGMLLLIDARNFFMHSRPRWDHIAVSDRDRCLVNGLKARVPIVHAFRQEIIFPHAFMTYGCAKWSVQTVAEFLVEFTTLLGVPNQLAPFNQQIELP